MKIRNHLSASGLYRLVGQDFAKIKDCRAENVMILLKALMSGFAMFSLKDSSLLAFDKRRQADGNLKSGIINDYYRAPSLPAH